MEELNWDNAKEWEQLANQGKNRESEPTWNWDCNFKLDFDGPILFVSSRFYPPHKNDHDGWEGKVEAFILGEPAFSRAFKTDSLEELRSKVESYRMDIANFLIFGNKPIYD